MAQHNPASRTFLLIVLAGIVIGFVIALFLFGGDDSETGAKMDETQAPSAEQPAADAAPEQPSSAQPAAEAPVERPVDDMSDGMTPPDEMPMDDGSMTPPDEMLDEPLPDAAPDAVSPEQAPEAAAPESPPPAPNP